MVEPDVWRAALRVRPGLYWYSGAVVRVEQPPYRGFLRRGDWLYYLGGHVWVVQQGERRGPGQGDAQRVDLVTFARRARRVRRG